MDGEPRQPETSTDVVSAEVPEAVDEWLTQTAEDLGIPRDRLAGRLLTELEAADGDGPVPDLAARIDALEDDVARKIEDVRDRVIQVKLETDEKAAADHEHTDLEGRIEQVASATKQTGSQVDTLEETLEELDERTEAGFENYEAILNDLIDTTEEVEDKLNTLAAAVLDVRESVEDLKASDAGGTTVAALAATANRNGIESAECGGCGDSVRISLLSEPVCPHCTAEFEDLQPRGGWLRSSLLVTTDPPAIDGDGDGEDAADPEAERDLEAIDGLGPTAATSLREAGVETVAQLAGGDPDTLAAATGLPEDRISRWIEQAEGRLGAGQSDRP